MTILIIISVFVLVVVFLGLSSVKLRLRFDKSVQIIEISYTLVRFRFLIRDLVGKIYFAGIPVKRLKLSRVDVGEKFMTAVRKEPDIKKRKKPIKFKLSDAKMVVYYLKKLRYTLSKIQLKSFSIDISDGFSDPFYTGQLYAIYTAARGIFPGLRSYISFRPDFSAESLKIRGEGLVLLKMFYILVPVSHMLADKAIEHLKLPFIKFRKGASYG